MVAGTPPEKLTAVVGAPAQTVWLDMVPAVGVGFTVMVKVIGVPVQPPAVGVTVMVLVTGVVPVLVAVNDPILPTPEPAKPMVVLLFVQLNTVPATEPEKLTAVVGEP